jgi:hypothetical protein
MKKEEKITVHDDKGFHYEVNLEHRPNLGFSSALYNGNIIGQVELGKIHEPLGDDDREWENYEERFAEWTDEIKTNIIPICENHFNNIAE